MYTKTNKDSKIIIVTLFVLLIICPSVNAYTEDFSVTQYRVPGVSRLYIL